MRTMIRLYIDYYYYIGYIFNSLTGFLCNKGDVNPVVVAGRIRSGDKEGKDS